MPSTDPLDCLVEIGALTIERMNTGKASAVEAFTLGQIAGIATRVPEVIERLKAMDADG